MKKNIFLISFILFLLFNKNVQAEPVINIIQKEIKPTTIQAIKQEIKPTIAAIRQETRERLNQATTTGERNEIKKEIREQNKGILDRIKNEVKEKIQDPLFSARISGKITEKGDNFLKVSSGEKVYQINITEKNQLRRRFWGKSNLNEFSVGDEVNVIGRYTNEEKTVIEAVLIRNLSIQKRWGAFFGEVKTISENYLIIKTLNRGDLTVYYQGAKLINRREEKISWSQIEVGHKIRVKGVWDKVLSKITEVDEVKDFSLPPLPTKIVNPTMTQ